MSNFCLTTSSLIAASAWSIVKPASSSFLPTEVLSKRICLSHKSRICFRSFARESRLATSFFMAVSACWMVRPWSNSFFPTEVFNSRICLSHSSCIWFLSSASCNSWVDGFMPRTASGYFLWKSLISSLAFLTASAGSHELSDSGYPFHLIKYCRVFQRPKRRDLIIFSTSNSSCPSMRSGGGFV